MNSLTDQTDLPIKDSEIEEGFAIDYDDAKKIATLACRGKGCKYMADVRLRNGVIATGIRNALLAHLVSHGSPEERFDSGFSDFRRRR